MNIHLKLQLNSDFKVYLVYIDAWHKKIHLVDHFSILIFFVVVKGLFKLGT